MEFYESDVDVDDCTTPKKRRKIRHELSKDEKTRTINRKLFRKEWLDDIKFKLWLEEDKSNLEKFKCKVCNVQLK